MEFEGKTCVVTGGGSGIGRALALGLHAAGARHIAIADLDLARAVEVADRVGGAAFECNAGREADILKVIRETENHAGPIDLMCSNAGVIDADPEFDNPASAPDSAWERGWAVHVMAHVYAARALLPGMIERRSGSFLHTVSAAGLLSQIGAAVYSTTKHAAIGFAESLAIATRDHGIGVTVLAPQAVATAMTAGGVFLGADVDGVLPVEEVAAAALEGVRQGRFLVLPHPRVAEYMRLKSDNYERWIGGMAKLRRAVQTARGNQENVPS